uniref:Immunoglobulin subtype domain-containing protein n=1 Tax=Cyprinus carpio TaxID=7962 RepID=A0A8C1T8B5_CYPCA
MTAHTHTHKHTLTSNCQFVFAGMFCHADAVKSVSVLEGDPVFLSTDVSKQHHEPMRWYFNDSLIALIIGHLNTSCLYDGEDGRFRDRLKVDYETGSLNITNITTEHAGRYEAELIRSESSGKSQSLNRNRKCDSTKITKKNINPEDIIITFRLTVSASDFGKNKNEPQIVPQDKEKKISMCHPPFFFVKLHKKYITM